MTLILAVGCDRYAVIVNDRRLTADGRLIDDDTTKSTVVQSNRVRLGLAFTGLATLGTFRTTPWLLESLSEALKPDQLLHVDRLAEMATRRFAALAAKDKDKRLSIVAAGFVTTADGIEPVLAWISNWEELASPRTRTRATTGPFQQWIYRRTAAHDTSASYVLAAGTTDALSDDEVRGLGRMAAEGRPAQAVVGKAVELVQQASRHPASAGLVGARCSSIALSADPAQETTTEYHTDRATATAYIPNLVTPTMITMDAFVSAPGKLIAVPKVGRNQPCPCGSGKKFKHCHGR